MTHTLHREGDVESLEDDYVVLAMPARGYNVEGSGGACRAFLDLADVHDAVNLGSVEAGAVAAHQFETVRSGTGDGTVVHAVFDDFAALERFLADWVDRDTGLSTVVSGLFERTERVCSRLDGDPTDESAPRPHTARYSLGVHGNEDRLPSPPERELSTMCGHGMVSVGLIRQMRDRVAAGRMDADQAAARLAEPCSCGVFNPSRASRLLGTLAGQYAAD